MKQNRQTSALRQAPASVDGRTMRRHRNRTAVITALLDMVREGNLHPGAAEIADRAGVSHRSIFRYFDDLDDLVRTTIDQALSDAEPISRIPDLGHGSLDDRVAAMVDARLALYANVDGPMQLARMRSYTIPSIDDEIASIAEHFREQLHQHFASELAGIDRPEREFVVDSILVLTSYDSYAIHLRLLASSLERMRASWITGVSALVSG